VLTISTILKSEGIAKDKLKDCERRNSDGEDRCSISPPARRFGKTARRRQGRLEREEGARLIAGAALDDQGVPVLDSRGGAASASSDSRPGTSDAKEVKKGRVIRPRRKTGSTFDYWQLPGPAVLLEC